MVELTPEFLKEVEEWAGKANDAEIEAVIAWMRAGVKADAVREKVLFGEKWRTPYMQTYEGEEQPSFEKTAGEVRRRTVSGLKSLAGWEGMRRLQEG